MSTRSGKGYIMRLTLGFVQRIGVFLTTLAVAIILGSGCGNCGDGVVAGHVSFMFDGKQYSGTTCIANSFPGGNSTSITCGADEGEWALMLEIPGTATGEFDEKAGATCSFVKPPFKMYDSEAVTITVSAYGKIGNAVGGTFSGMLVNQLDSTRKPITDGTFTAQRHFNVE